MLCHSDEPVALCVSVYCHGKKGVDRRDDIHPKQFHIWSLYSTFVGRVWRTAYGGCVAFVGASRTQEGRSVSPEHRLSASKPLKVSKLIRFQHVESACV